MATLLQPINRQQVAGLAGSVDFYYWKTIPVARAWPARPRQPGTPAQKTTWHAFARAAAAHRALPRELWEIWRATIPPPRRNPVNIYRALVIRLLGANLYTQMPAVAQITRHHSPIPSLDTVTLQIANPNASDQTMIAWRYHFPRNLLDRLAWRIIEILCPSLSLKLPPIEPRLNGWMPPAAQTYNPATKIWRLAVRNRPGPIQLLPVPRTATTWPAVYGPIYTAP